MHIHSAIALLTMVTGVSLFAADGTTWLLQYNGKGLPQEQGWSTAGRAVTMARLVDGALQIRDDSVEESGSFRASWTPDPSREIVVEARIRFESMAAEGTRLRTGFAEGAPVSLMVSDGRRQEGIMLYPDRVASFLDRVYMMDTRNEFHTYRLVIRGTDMSVFVDDQLRIRGEGAFWKPAESPQAFVQFGSNSAKFKGASRWASVRLGTRPAASLRPKPKLRITVSEPWEIAPVGGIRSTRPYLSNVDRGVLLLSVAQGPDAYFEPYGVLKSTDQGKTWAPIAGLQEKTFAPLPFVRLPDGDILGVSRWNLKYDRDDGVYVGMSYRFDADAKDYRVFEYRMRVPAGMGPSVIFDRHIFVRPDGEIRASVYGTIAGSNNREFRNYLVSSTDRGQTWTHFSTVGENPEPGYVMLPGGRMTALMRTGPRRPLIQKWSDDAGKTWSVPTTLEVASVDPDLVYMSNGVLACSYGRPGSNLMFSTDHGRTWGHHQVITDEHGFNYTAICEVSPGRLLYLHDAPRLRALHVEVERLN